MDSFHWIAVAVSMILGIGVTRLLTSAVMIVRNREVFRLGVVPVEKCPILVYGRDRSGGYRAGLSASIIAHFDAVAEAHACNELGQELEAVEPAPAALCDERELEHEWHDGFA